MKKKEIFVFLFIILINLISAIDLDISSKPITDTVVSELETPAVFEITVRNLGETDKFEFYSLVGVEISPSTPIDIKSGESKKIEIEVIPQDSLKLKTNLPITIEYKIKNSKNEIQTENLLIYISSLENAFTVQIDPINPHSEKTVMYLKNNINFNFENAKIKSASAFFEYAKTISLKPKEKVELEIPIDKEKLSVLGAGKYLSNTEIQVENKKTMIESRINFLETEDLETSDNKEGFLIQRREITIQNIGNTRKIVEIKSERNIFSYLFTTTSSEPVETKLTGFKVYYTWKKELIPNEEIKVIIKTNWFYPILIIILIYLIIIFIRRSIYSDLILNKKVSFVKTTGGQFALKVSLVLKSKRYIDKIKVIDKLPPLVTLYDKFGAIHPDNIDLHNKRLEWNIPSLNKGESRIFTYIIYSKIGVVGRFELPEAKAVYEKEGKIKETRSNRSFYIREPKEI